MMKRPGGLAFLWLLLSAGSLLLPGTRAADPAAPQEEDLTVDLRQMWAAFDRARARIDDLDFGGAIRELDGIIEPRKGRPAASFGADELKLITSARDLRARSAFNLGNARAAEADFTALLALDPGYDIDRQTLSPKVVDLFDRVRLRVAGILMLQVDPPEARVLVDGEPVDMRRPGGVALLAGDHELRIEMEGYDTRAARLSVGAGKELRHSVRLVPNRRTLEFITVPQGVEISIDGKPVGRTQGPPTPDIVALAPRYNFDPANASAALAVPLVTPGEHRVTFDCECYESRSLTIKVALDTEANQPLRFAPVVLPEARTELRITSLPPGASVTIDGVPRGNTPLTIGALCGGERDVVVARQDVGLWSERIRVTPGRVNALDVRLRPTLLYAGTFRLDEWGRAVWSDEDRALLDELAKGLQSLNVVRDPDILQAVRQAIVAWMISDPQEVRGGTILPPAILQDAGRKAGADLVLAGLTLAEDPDHAWTLALYSVQHPVPDVVVLRTDRADGVADFARRLDSPPAESSTWWGLGMVDSLINEGPLVVRVVPGSPAAKAGLRVGDRIRAVGSDKVQDVRETMRALASESQRSAGIRAPVLLAVEDTSGSRTIRLAPGEGPHLIPLTDPALLYNRALAEFRLRARAAAEEAARGVALLNVGIAYMHFRAYDRAQSEGFSRATLPAGPGISEGTVLYYRGLCSLRRGDPGAAREALERAATAASSTVESGDGPSASAAAARMLAAMR